MEGVGVGPVALTLVLGPYCFVFILHAAPLLMCVVHKRIAHHPRPHLQHHRLQELRERRLSVYVSKVCIRFLSRGLGLVLDLSLGHGRLLFLAIPCLRANFACRKCHDASHSPSGHGSAAQRLPSREPCSTARLCKVQKQRCAANAATVRTNGAGACTFRLTPTALWRTSKPACGRAGAEESTFRQRLPNGKRETKQAYGQGISPFPASDVTPPTASHTPPQRARGAVLC